MPHDPKDRGRAPGTAFIPLTPVDGLESVLALLVHEAGDRIHDLNPGLGTLLTHQHSPPDVAQAWKALMDDDGRRTGPRDPVVRNITLVALLAAFEHWRLRDYRQLRVALGQFTTRSGSPMSVIGTRCELVSRAAEGLYSEARRTPGEHLSASMLTLAASLISAALVDCKQRDNNDYLKRWRGIRGVCRLMIATHNMSGSDLDHLVEFSAAAEDLETAFLLGNRGPSAVAFVLDSLLHLLDFDPSAGTCARFDAIAASLTSDERRNRSVLFLLGRYRFFRAFQTNDVAAFRTAVEYLDEALKFQPDLSSDDGFVRLVRGQVLIRLSMAQEVAELDFLEALSAGIDDLRWAYETSPHKYAQQRSLQSALVSRAKRLSSTRDYVLAKADVEYLLGRPDLCAADPPTALAAELTGLLVDLRRAQDENDLPGLEIALRRALDHSQCPAQGAVAVSMAARHLFFNKGPEDDPGLLRRTLEVLESADLQGPQDSVSLRMNLSLRARLYLMYGTGWRPEALDKAVELSTGAIDASPVAPEPELLSLCGETLLQCAKRDLDGEGPHDLALDSLEQAGDCFRQAAEAVETGRHVPASSFQLAVTHSKAGESYLRLCGLTASSEYAQKAIDSFERAFQLGNRTPALLGLLGDAYYRLFRITRRPELLALALAKKSESRDTGVAPRENLSLSAKLQFIRWEASSNREDLISAIRLCAEAHEASPNWPWPAFQLAEIVEHADDLTIEAATAGDDRTPSLKLLDLARLGRDALLEFGCRLVIADEEFDKKTLGGRQPVYVLKDPHRLLSSSYVFKHTRAASANRDRQVIEAFDRFLRGRNLTGLGLPVPVAIVPHGRGDNAVYVMRRAPGSHLGRLAVRARNEGTAPPIREFERAVGFLAAFHAWGDSINAASTGPALDFVKAYLRDPLDLLPDILPASTRRALSAVGRVPQVLKKDAHPENWLVDDRGRLSMLDFESTRIQPMPFEVVQLIDDYPLLPLTESGWAKRLELCRGYLARWAELSEASTPVDLDSIELFYGVCLVLRAKFGSRHATRPATARRSSSALRANVARREHYRDVLAWLTVQHSNEGVRELARVMDSRSS